MSKPVLILIDMQKHFFEEDLLVQRREALARSSNELIAIARDNECPVVWVKLAFKPDLSNAMLEMKKRGSLSVLKGQKAVNSFRNWISVRMIMVS